MCISVLESIRECVCIRERVCIRECIAECVLSVEYSRVCIFGIREYKRVCILCKVFERVYSLY